MCGIAGLLRLSDASPPVRVETVERMARAMFHRGPDELGLYRDAHAGLAHARLSIIDLSTGQQPLGDADGTSHIVYNGEVFNYVELRAELEAAGVRFRTHSDTEVVLAAWETWGESCFARFNGQWAIAIWDRKRRRLVLSRDRLGVRPLHLLTHDSTLYFGSEVKAIFAADPSIPRELDPMGLAETFTFWSIVPPQSVYAHVEELPPGVCRVIDFDGGRALPARDYVYYEQSYPTSREAGFRGTIEEATEAVEAALREATRLRMVRSDVPVGSYLSGGLDSSLVAALGLKAKGENFSTYSLRFQDAEYDETEYQRIMAKHIESDHHEVVVSRRDIAESFADVVFHTERPILRTAPAPLFLLSKLVRASGIKVVLTGEGADEMFAGYDLFREAKVRRFWAKAPHSKSRPMLLDRLYPYLARSPVAQRAMAMQFFGRDLAHASEPGFGHSTRWHGAAALHRLFTPRVRDARTADPVARLLADLPAAFSRWTPLAQDQYLEIRTLLSGYLLSSQGDRMLMANSVEGRFPFLDKNVIELAASLPDSYKLHVLDEKHVLKRAARTTLPAAVLNRKKQPYRAPDALAFTSGPLPAAVEHALSDSVVRAAGIFEPEQVARLVAKCRAKADGQFSNADNMAFVGVLSTQLVHTQLIDAAPRLTDAPFKTRIDFAPGSA
ncbi:MAG: asparagine synthase (glutamine-hydrolyzing) [Polyangiaceae bacterium]